MKTTLYNILFVFAQLGKDSRIMAHCCKIFIRFHYEFETMCEAMGDMGKFPTLRGPSKSVHNINMGPTCVLEPT